MSLNTSSAIHRQVAAVRRRLLLQSLIRALAWGWFAALALSAVWFLVEPLLFRSPPGWLRWTVLGVALLQGTAIPAALALARRASPVHAALALDEQFRLKERVTTSLLLRPDEAASPAGVALLADADQRVRPLRIGEGFPVRLPWTAALAPAAAVGLFLVIYFYHPDFTKAQGLSQEQRDEAMAAEIKPVQDELKKKSEERKKDPAKTEELKRIEAEIDNMVGNKHDTPKAVEEDIKKGDELQNDLKKQDQAAAEKERELKDRLDGLQRAARDRQEAAGLAQKLGAAAEAEELKKKIAAEQDPAKKEELQDELKKKEDEAVKPEDRAQAEQDLKDLKDDADRLEQKDEAEQKKLDDDAKKLDDAAKKLDDDAKKLEEDAKKDGADKDQLQKEKDQIDKEKDELKKKQDQLQNEQKDLKDASQKLGQAQQALQQGKDGEAAKQLQQAGDKLGQAGKDDAVKQAAQAAQAQQDERDRIGQDMKQVQDMKKALSQGLAKQEGQDGNQGDQAGKDGQGKPGDQGGKPGNQAGDQAGDQQGQGQGPGGKGTGSGSRPEGDGGDTGEENHRVHVDPNDKAHQTVVDKVDGPHDRFNGPKKPEEMKDDLRRAAQEGEAAAADEKVTDKGSADTSREWFQAIRPPDEKKPK